MTPIARRPALLLTCAALLGAAAVSTAHADAGLDPAQRHSATRTPELSDLTLQRRAGAPVRVGFDLTLPRVGRAGDRADVEIAVSAAAGAEDPVPVRRRRSIDAEGTTRVTFVLRGPAAQRLRGAKSERAALGRIGVTVWHARQLDDDEHLDHTMVVSERGTAIARRHGRRPRARAAARGAVLSLRNATGGSIITSTAPLTCVRDNGDEGSNLSALDSRILSPDAAISAYVENDGNVDSGPAERYGPPNRRRDPPQGQVLTYAAALLRYSPSIRGLVLATTARFVQGGAPGLFREVVDDLPLRGTCVFSESVFAVGADLFVGGEGRPTGPHAEVTARITGSREVSVRDRLASVGLAIRMAGDETMVVEARPEACRPTGGPSWMACAMPAGSEGARRRLSDVAFPGSHDSGTGTVIGDPAWLMRGRASCTDYDSVMDNPDVAAITQRFAVTQNLTIRDQLDLGIRYLDLRAAYDPGGGPSVNGVTDPGGAWRLVHTLFAQDLLVNETQAIATWAAAHPDEVVIVDLNHVCANGAGYDGFVSALAERSKVTGLSLCDVAYRASNPAQLSATTIEQIRASGRNVVLLVDGDVRGACGVRSRESSPNPPGGQADDRAWISYLWPRVQGPGGCLGNHIPAVDAVRRYPVESATPSLRTFRDQRPVVPLLQTQILFTASDPLTVVVNAIECKDLREYERVLNAQRTNIIRDWVAKGARPNIVVADFVDAAYVEALARLNG